jgi:hypothetical protein
MTRTAYDLTVEGFGPGANGPLLLVAELPPVRARVRSIRSCAAARADPRRRVRLGAAGQPGRARGGS